MKASGKKKTAVDQTEDVGLAPHPLSNTEQEKNHLRRILKKLSLLKLLKRTDRRILRLRALALSYWKSLAFEEPPSLPAVSPGASVSSTDTHVPPADAGADPLSEAEDMDTDPADGQSNPALPLETQPVAVPQNCRFEDLPKRLHLPAPRVLCRPATQRWMKPCCTRSCGETLEHILTINYQE